MEEIIQFDKHLLLILNGSDSTFLDSVIMTLTTAQTWIPLYIALFYVVVMTNVVLRPDADNKSRWTGVAFVVLAAAACVLLAGAIDDTFVKPTVARWRPTHDPEIGALVDVVNDYRGGRYGFFSAHAANTFSIAVFFSLLMRRRLFGVAMVTWSLVNCYTRLYLGVHYPGDITVGLLWGGFVGWLVYRVYCRVTPPAHYPLRLCVVPVCVFLLTVVFAVVKALIVS